jgi:hypothetical protein
MSDFFDTGLDYLFKNEIDEWFESGYKKIDTIQLSLNYEISQFQNETLSLNYQIGTLQPPLKRLVIRGFDEV